MGSANRFDEAGQMKDEHDVKESIKKTSGNAKSGSQQAKGALLESESHYRLLVENANEAICVACDGMLRYVNPKTEEITGYSRGELMSKPFIDFVHPDDRNMIIERHARRLRGEQFLAVYAFRAIDKYGNTKWLEISAVLITWEGRPATLNFLTDITERKRAEEALRKSDLRFRDLVDLLPEAIYELDLDGRLTFANQRAFELSGYSRDDLDGGVNALQLFIPEDRARVRQNIAMLLVGKDLGLQQYTAKGKMAADFLS